MDNMDDMDVLGDNGGVIKLTNVHGYYWVRHNPHGANTLWPFLEACGVEGRLREIFLPAGILRPQILKCYLYCLVLLQISHFHSILHNNIVHFEIFLSLGFEDGFPEAASPKDVLKYLWLSISAWLNFILLLFYTWPKRQLDLKHNWVVPVGLLRRNKKRIT